MSARMTRTNPAVLSYHTLRRAVGVIAVSLPFVLATGAILIRLACPPHALPQPLLQRSISDYYYTPMGNYLIGSLGAIAAFLICTRGYDLTDEIAGYLGGVFTLGAALFPAVDPRTSLHSAIELHIQTVHTSSAALMFLTLSYFCLFLFRKSAPDRRITRRKRHRNKLYLTCGLVITACMLVMVAVTFFPIGRQVDHARPLLISETLALVAFGIAWLTKGEVFLKDRHHDQAATTISHSSSPQPGSHNHDP
jgi:hypothetical protein